MPAHGQTDFVIQCIAPDSRTVRSDHPDFVVLRHEPGGRETCVIVEIKADNEIDAAGL
ncbi:hypothetical protein [Azospirillum sp. sgz302134]